MSWLVYKHVSPSHKVYIGITHLLPSQRWCRGNGYKHTDEYKERMRILQLGKPKNPLSVQKQKETKTLYSYHHTDDAKRKIAEASRFTDHSKAAMFAKIANSRSVVLRTVDGEIREFNSAKFLKVSEWKVSVSIKEHRFVKEVRGYLEANLK